MDQSARFDVINIVSIAIVVLFERGTNKRCVRVECVHCACACASVQLPTSKIGVVEMYTQKRQHGQNDHTA